MAGRKQAAVVLGWIVAGAWMATPVCWAEVSSPQNWQVFQREADNSATVPITGQVPPDCQQVELALTGADSSGARTLHWQRLAECDKQGRFAEHMQVPAGGWYDLQVRHVSSDQTILAVEKVRFGVGELLVTCGQSNACNHYGTLTQVRSGMVSNFDGVQWVSANDPQPGGSDGAQAGSIHPRLGDLLADALGVPIGVSMAGHGSTVVQDWVPGAGTGRFEWLRNRVLALGSNQPRCLLWHQGESNAATQLPQPAAEYAQRLNEIRTGLNTAIGYQLPWITCQATYMPPEMGWPQTKSETIRAQQQWLWDSGSTLRGPDTDLWRAAYRNNFDYDRIHFNQAGMRAWAYEAFLCFMEHFIHPPGSFAAPRLVWRIGTADGNWAELGIPGQYGQYNSAFPSDVDYTIGVSTASQWPYVHPGPGNSWAGSRTHPFRIRFQLAQVPTQCCRLVVGLCGTDSSTPGRLTVSINGRTPQLMQVPQEFQLPYGAGTPALTSAGAGNRRICFLDFEPADWQTGENEIVLTSTDTWLTYDYVELQSGVLKGAPLTAVWCPGDADGDRFVSGSDYRTVRDHFGASGCGPGDADGDCFVSGSDYRTVRDSFGSSCQ